MAGAGANQQNFSDPVENLNFVAERFGGQNSRPQQVHPNHERFGGLRPFEHHHVPEEIKDHFQY